MACQVRTFGRCVWDSGSVLANLWYISWRIVRGSDLSDRRRLKCRPDLLRHLLFDMKQNCQRRTEIPWVSMSNHVVKTPRHVFVGFWIQYLFGRFAIWSWKRFWPGQGAIDAFRKDCIACIFEISPEPHWAKKIQNTCSWIITWTVIPLYSGYSLSLLLSHCSSAEHLAGHQKRIGADKLRPRTSMRWFKVANGFIWHSLPELYPQSC